MKTINSIIDQFTNPEILYSDLLEALREIDPCFVAEEAQFTDAVTRLKEALSSDETNVLDTYLTSAREEIAAITVYTGWLGFQLNLDCWQDPIHKLMLDHDYEEITQERSFGSIPAIKQARTKMEASAKAIPVDLKELLSNIVSYFSYLHTMVPKLAHLFGFKFADEFLYHVIPGYCSDSVCTLQYTRDLEKHLSLHHVS